MFRFLLVTSSPRVNMPEGSSHRFQLKPGVERGGLERAKLEEELQPLGLKGARDGRSRGILTSCKSSSHTWPMAARGMFTCLGVKPGEWG